MRPRQQIILSAIAGLLVGILATYSYDTYRLNKAIPVYREIVPTPTPNPTPVPTVAPATEKCVDKNYTVRRGNSLWRIARREWGQGHLYPLIVKANPEIKNPNLIFVDEVIVIPCQTNGTITTTVSQSSSEPGFPEVSRLEVLPTSMLDTLAMIVPQAIPQTEVEFYQELNSDQFDFATKEYAIPEINLDVGKHLQNNAYQIEISAKDLNGASPGEFPGILLDKPDKKGAWRELTKTTVALQKLDTNTFLCLIPSKNNLSKAGVVVFDLGGGNLIQISEAELSRAKSDAHQNKKFNKRDYTALTRTFPKKQSSAMLIASRTLPWIVRSGTGYAMGGPVGALLTGPVPAATGFMIRKIEKQNPEQNVADGNVLKEIQDLKNRIELLEEQNGKINSESISNEIEEAQPEPERK